MKPLFVLWVFAASYVGAHENIVISTPQGEIDGLADIARDGDKFYAFRGVPFAQPPTGEFRYFNFSKVLLKLHTPTIFFCNTTCLMNSKLNISTKQVNSKTEKR